MAKFIWFITFMTCLVPASNGQNAFEAKNGITATPWDSESLGKATASLAWNGVTGVNYGSNQGDLFLTVTPPGKSTITVCLAKVGNWPGQSDPESGTKFYVTQDWIEKRNINQLSYVFVHEAWECGFVQDGLNMYPDFWDWANDTSACNGDMECIREKLGASVACGHASASAEASEAACSDVPPPCPNSGSCGFQLAPNSKEEKCSIAHNQRKQCVKAMDPMPVDPPDVKVPKKDGDFDDVKGGAHKDGACAAGLAAVPAGIAKPPAPTCPPPCANCQ